MNIATIRSTAATILVAALAACSGTSGPSLPTAATQTQSAKTPAHRSKHKIKVKLRITIPKRKHHRRVKIHGHYISPATQSIEISITPQGGSPTQYNQDLSAVLNPECRQSLVSPLICTVSISLEPGSYTGTFTTYDGLLSGAGGNTDPGTGNQLSANQNVPFSIAAGQANQINVALDGIPAAVALVPAADSTLSGNMAAGFTGAKCGSVNKTGESVSVFGIDADGNYILGAGAPVPSLSSPTTTVVAISTPSPNNPNGFVITHPIAVASQAPVQLTETVTPSVESGADPVSAQTNVQIMGGSNICGLVTQYTIATAHADPEGIVSGPNGKLWFTEYGANKIASITTSGTIAEGANPTANAEPFQIGAGLDNHLYFTDLNGGIGNSTTDFSISEFTSGLQNTGPKGMVLNSGDVVWFTECTAGHITAFSDLIANDYAIPTPPSHPSPSGITIGPDGNFWFAQQDGHIGMMTPAGAYTSNGGAVLSGTPQMIATAAGGDMWFSEQFYDGVGRITTNGTITEYPASSGAYGVAPGPDGNIWFTEQNASVIASITTDGAITEFPVPHSQEIDFITAGPDGAMWFTEPLDNKIVKMQ